MLKAAEIIVPKAGNLTVGWGSLITGKVQWLSNLPQNTKYFIGYLLGKSTEDVFYVYPSGTPVFFVGSARDGLAPAPGTTLTTDILGVAYPYIGSFDAWVWVGAYGALGVDIASERVVGIGIDSFSAYVQAGNIIDAKWYTSVLTINMPADIKSFSFVLG